MHPAEGLGRRTAVAIISFVLVGTFPADVAAVGTTFNVDSTADAPDAVIDGVCGTSAEPPVCTLRAAIQEANATVDADVIVLPAGKYALKLTGAGEEAAATGDLD